MKREWILCLAILISVLGLPWVCGCHRQTAATPAPSSEPAPKVTATHPFRGEITRAVTLPGEIKAYQQATLYAKVSGYLKRITVDKGDPVQEGALLAEIEVPELLADQAKSKAELQVAEIDYQRVSEAQKKAPDLVVPLTVDSAKSRYEVARANLERTETLLGFTKIVAPFSGVITRRMVDAGALIPAATAGNPQSAALLTLAEFDRVRVQIAVPEIEASLIAKDQPVRVGVDGLPGRFFEGKITRFSYSLDESTKTMLAESELPNPKLELRPGMYAVVKIGLERKENALLVPADAVLLEKTNASVFTVVESRAKKVPLRIGFNDGRNVEVLTGVKPDDWVILLEKRSLNDGQRVNAAEEK